MIGSWLWIVTDGAQPRGDNNGAFAVPVDGAERGHETGDQGQPGAQQHPSEWQEKTDGEPGDAVAAQTETGERITAGQAEVKREGGQHRGVTQISA